MKKLIGLFLVAIVATSLAGCGGSGSSSGGGSGGGGNPDPDLTKFQNRAIINVADKGLEGLVRQIYNDLLVAKFEASATEMDPETGNVRFTFRAKYGSDIGVNDWRATAVLVDDAGIEPDMPVDLTYAAPKVVELASDPLGLFVRENIIFDFITNGVEHFPLVSAGKTLAFYVTADLAMEETGGLTGIRVAFLSDTEKVNDGKPTQYADLIAMNSRLIWYDGLQTEDPVLESGRFGNGQSVKTTNTENGHLPASSRTSLYIFTEDGTNPFDPFANKPIFVPNADLGAEMIVDGILTPGKEKDVPLQRFFMSSGLIDGQILLGHGTNLITVSQRPKKDETFEILEISVVVEHLSGDTEVLSSDYITVEKLDDQGDGYDRFVVLADPAAMSKLVSIDDEGAFVTLVATVKAPGIASVKDAYLSIEQLGDNAYPDERPSDYTGVINSNFAWGDGSDLNPGTALTTKQWGNSQDFTPPYSGGDVVTYQYRPEHGDIVVTRDAPPTN